MTYPVVFAHHPAEFAYSDVLERKSGTTIGGETVRRASAGRANHSATRSWPSSTTPTTPATICRGSTSKCLSSVSRSSSLPTAVRCGHRRPVDLAHADAASSISADAGHADAETGDGKCPAQTIISRIARTSFVLVVVQVKVRPVAQVERGRPIVTFVRIERNHERHFESSFRIRSVITARRSSGTFPSALESHADGAVGASRRSHRSTAASSPFLSR